jgi:hypothetical protein
MPAATRTSINAIVVSERRCDNGRVTRDKRVTNLFAQWRSQRPLERERRRPRIVHILNSSLHSDQDQMSQMTTNVSAIPNRRRCVDHYSRMVHRAHGEQSHGTVAAFHNPSRDRMGTRQTPQAMHQRPIHAKVSAWSHGRAV